MCIYEKNKTDQHPILLYHDQDSTHYWGLSRSWTGLGGSLCRPQRLESSHESLTAVTDALFSQEIPIDCIIHNAGFNPRDQKERAGYFESTFYCRHFNASNVTESMMINALHPMEMTGRLMPVLTNDAAAVLAIPSWSGSIGNKTVPGHYGYPGSMRQGIIDGICQGPGKLVADSCSN